MASYQQAYPTPVQSGAYPGPQQQNMGQPFGTLPTGQALYNMGGQQPYPFYQRSWFNPLEQQGFGTQLAGGQQSIADAYGLRPLLGNFYGTAMQSMMDTMQSGGNVPPMNPYGSGAIEGAVNQLTGDVTRKIMPGIDIAAANAGQTGSSRHGVLQANALRDAQQVAGDIGAQQQGRDYNSWLGAWGRGQDQTSRAWGMVPGMFSGFESAYLRPSDMMTGYGGLQQGIGAQHRGLTDQFMGDQAQQWQQRQAQPYNNLNWYSGILGGVPGGLGTQTQTTPGASPMSSALGGAALGYGIYDMFNKPTNTLPTWSGSSNPWLGGGMFSPTQSNPFAGFGGF